MPVCRLFMLGKCKYGEQCKFEHPADQTFGKNVKGRKFRKEKGKKKKCGKTSVRIDGSVNSKRLDK